MENSLSGFEFQKTRVSDQISSLIKKAILGGRLKPGDKLPPEEKIAAQFKVSKVAVREALRGMEAEGLIEKQRGVFGGSYVSEPGSTKIEETVINCYQFGSLTLQELAEFRQLLEPALLKMAINRCTKKYIQLLRANIDECEMALEKGKPDLGKHVAFHVLIADACRNQLASAVMRAVTKIFEAVTSKFHLTLKDFRLDLDYNKKFLECIINLETDRAQELMFNHFELTKEFVKRSKANGEPDS